MLNDSPQAVLGVPSYLELVLQQTSEVWANPFGGARRGVVYSGLLEMGAEIDLGEAGWLAGASLGAVGFFIQGGDISAEAVGDAGVVSNIAGLQAARLFSLWYEQRAFRDAVSLKLGLIPLDDDFMLLESALLFVNSGFGLLQTLALNVPTPVYPLGALGLRLRVQPSREWTVQFGAYDGDAGAEPEDRPVSDIALSSDQAATLVIEAAWAPRSGWGQVAGGGVLHLCLLDNPTSGAQERGIGLFYLMLERRLSRDAVAFAHVSVVWPSERAVTAAYADAGAVFTGRTWGRPNDRFGVGVTWTRFAGPYVEAERAAGRSISRTEWVVELTYEVSLLSWIRVQPSVQWIGQAHFAMDNVVALGLRGSINL